MTERALKYFRTMETEMSAYAEGARQAGIIIGKLMELGKLPKQDTFSEPQVISVGRFSLNCSLRILSVDSDNIELTARESRVTQLILTSGVPISVQALAKDIFGEHSSTKDYNTIRRYVANLREKFKEVNPALDPIKTIRNLGYQFISENPELS